MTSSLANVIFKKYTIINKGTKPFENAYLSYWSDPDLGDATDDLVGCDTNLQMGYAYNGGSKDAVYGVACPAVGYTYLQGPTIKSDDPNDVTIWNFDKKYGYKNLPMTSFTCFGGYATIDGDFGEPSSTYAGAIKFYELIKGNGRYGHPWINPITGEATKFFYTGDPVTRTGWIDGTGNYNPRDVRLMLSSGPFTLAVDDTQEVVIAIVVGQGAIGSLALEL